MHLVRSLNMQHKCNSSGAFVIAMQLQHKLSCSFSQLFLWPIQLLYNYYHPYMLVLTTNGTIVDIDI